MGAYPSAACCRHKGHPSGWPLPFEGADIRTHVYIDGFNLYYGALKQSPYKWLDVVKLAQQIIDPSDTVDRVKYFTARVSGSADPGAPGRQQKYLSALNSLPEVEVIFGNFMAKTIWRPLANLPVAGATIHSPTPVNLPQGNHSVSGGSLKNAAVIPSGIYGNKRPRSRNRAIHPMNNSMVVEVHTMEEKGSDVNLAAHLLNDAWKGEFEAALVITNDTDLCVPIRMVATERNIPVYVACPQLNAALSPKLAAVATYERHIRSGMLAASQLPDQIQPLGLSKPIEW